VPVTLRTYGVVATGPDAGLIEALPDTVSLDALRRNDARYRGLLDFFRRHFGSGPALAAARTNFVESLAPACILSYLLQIKDRHNGNILLDASGRVVHIDFGYMLASSPGGNLGFEAAPFKLTADFLEVIGPDYRRFRELCVRTFLALREDRHRLVLLAEMTVSGCDHLPCFDGRPRETIDALQKRFRPKLSDRACRAFVFGLIDKSTNNWRTSLYDEYQRCCVGIL
jgi:phosphatidylinositol 4-kinase